MVGAAIGPSNGHSRTSGALWGLLLGIFGILIIVIFKGSGGTDAERARQRQWEEWSRWQRWNDSRGKLGQIWALLPAGWQMDEPAFDPALQQWTLRVYDPMERPRSGLRERDWNAFGDTPDEAMDSLLDWLRSGGPTDTPSQSPPGRQPAPLSQREALRALDSLTTTFEQRAKSDPIADDVGLIREFESEIGPLTASIGGLTLLRGADEHVQLLPSGRVIASVLPERSDGGNREVAVWIDLQTPEQIADFYSAAELFAAVRDALRSGLAGHA